MKILDNTLRSTCASSIMTSINYTQFLSEFKHRIQARHFSNSLQSRPLGIVDDAGSIYIKSRITSPAMFGMSDRIVKTVMLAG